MVTEPDRTLDHFGEGVSAASLSALLELSLAWRSYKEAIVLVGGWAPFFLLETYKAAGDPYSHVGSIDIDVAVNPKLVDDDAYASIESIIQGRGYELRLDRVGNPIAFSYAKTTVDSKGRELRVVVDFLGPEAGGRGKEHRTQVVQDDFRLRKARGVDVVFAHCFPYRLDGRLPNGARASTDILVADLVGCLTTKGMAIGDRYKEKDAYDVYSVIAHSKSGPREVAAEVAPFIEDPLVKEGINHILDAFKAIDANGPAWVADFLGATGLGRERIIADSYSEVARFADELGRT